jgi:hypothetical protein
MDLDLLSEIMCDQHVEKFEDPCSVRMNLKRGFRDRRLRDFPEVRYCSFDDVQLYGV